MSSHDAAGSGPTTTAPVQRVSLTPASTLLGREILEIDESAGAVRCRFFARDEFANRHGTVQGGFLAAMLDSACGIAVLFGLPPERTAVTVRLDVRYLKPARLGEMRSNARIAQREDRTVIVDGELADAAGTVVASARGEFRIVARRSAGDAPTQKGDQASRG